MSRRRRRPPRLPPSWVRRCDWRFHGEEVEFYFPGLDHAAEGQALQRLCDWSEQHTDLLASWMAKVDCYRAPNQCGCQACTERGGIA
jgi:hypothetical protein